MINESLNACLWKFFISTYGRLALILVWYQETKFDSAFQAFLVKIRKKKLNALKLKIARSKVLTRKKHNIITGYLPAFVYEWKWEP